MESLLAFLPDAIGCLGAFIVLIVYALLQMRRMRPDTFLYSFLNFIAALMILVSLIYAWNLAAVVIEVIWMLLSAYGIYKYFSKVR